MKLFSLKKTMISLGLSVVIALFFLLLDTSNFLNNLLSAVLIAILSFVIIFVTCQLYDYVLEIGVHKKFISNYEMIFQQGINNYYGSFKDIDLKPSLAKTKVVRIMLIYSKSLIDEYYNQFKEFLSNKGSLLEVIIHDPNKEEEGYKYLSKKFSYDDLDRKISDLEKRLKELKKDAGEEGGKIILYFSNYIPQQSITLFDNEAFLIFYKTTPGRDTAIPAFRLKRDSESSLYKFIERDFNDIISLSRKVEL